MLRQLLDTDAFVRVCRRALAPWEAFAASECQTRPPLLLVDYNWGAAGYRAFLFSEDELDLLFDSSFTAFICSEALL